MQASEVINRCIIDDVRLLLHHPDKSVKEISNELGFPQSVVFRQICEKNARNVAEGLPQVARRYCRRMIAERIRPELMPNVLAEKNR